MTIECACFGNLNRDGELKTSRNGKDYLLLSITTGREDTAQRVGVLCFDQDALAQNDKFVRGARVYLEGSLKAGIWTDQQGMPRVDLTVLSWHCKLAAIGRNRPRRDNPPQHDASVAGGYVAPRSAPAGRLPDDEIPFAPEVR